MRLTRSKRGWERHMLSGLAIDGRFGLTAIASSVTEAIAMEAATRDAVDRVTASGG